MISNPVLDGGVIAFVEVQHLQMMAIASQPNTVTLWDFHERKLLFRFEADHITISKITYSRKLQILITNGYEDVLCCYSLHPVYYDHNLVAKWHAKCSLILAFEVHPSRQKDSRGLRDAHHCR